jgi:hypothetical protein
MAIMGSVPPTGVKIHATDMNHMFLAQMRAKLTENLWWPVKIETMNAWKISSTGNTFDLSLTSFVFSGLSDDIGAA